MTSILNLNEFNLLRLLVLIVSGQQPYVLDVDPLFPPTRRLLEAVLRWARRTGRVRNILDLCPEVAHVQLRWSQVYLLNVLGKIETWQNERFRFEQLDAAVPDYARAIKATVVNYLRQHYHALVPLAIATPKLEPKGVRIHGVLPSTLGAAEAYGKVSLAHLAAPVPVWLFPVINALMAVGCALYGLGWLVTRLRLKVDAQPVWLMADYTGDPRDYGICEELRDGGSIMLHVREMSGLEIETRNFHRYPHCRPMDGLVDPKTGLTLAWLVVRDVAKL
ncbi:MAG: hypothetical protein K2X44_06805, partial [Magnetospirillum sp.]|nr:hypothetical protein [Magnetospirillum sp.]